MTNQKILVNSTSGLDLSARFGSGLIRIGWKMDFIFEQLYIYKKLFVSVNKYNN
jgi:hypothetical protein